MNANEIVDILIETGLSPDEFISGNPDITAYFEFGIDLARNKFSVKRWSDGSYYYIGKVGHDTSAELWYAYEVPPVGRLNHSHIIPDAPFRKSRIEAAKDLWKHYERELNDHFIVSS